MKFRKMMAGILAASLIGSMTIAGSVSADELDSSAKLEVWIWDSDQQDGIQEICDLFTDDTGI
ncbi:MAG: sugar ABC transporter substrate-binding protein, partial [Clostridiales bacterium]|nr:sugar ABC transporter substrate-binding protein [Clostridiales bacterium]